MDNIDKNLNDLLSQMNNDVPMKSSGNDNQYIIIMKKYSFHICLLVIIIISVYYTKPSVFYNQEMDPKTKKPIQTFIWSKCFIYICVLYISIIGIYYIHTYYFCNNNRI